MMVRHVMLLLAAALFCLQSGCASHFCSTGDCGRLPGGKVAGPVVSDCADCGGGGCGSCLSHVKSHIHDGLTCGSGCGQLVWDEWIDNPPDCCDPCDDCGNWTGVQSCFPRLLSHCNLWGLRTGACTDGCSTCSGDVQYIDSHPLQKGGVIIEQEATPTAKPEPDAAAFDLPPEPPSAARRPPRRGYLFQ